MFNPMNEPRQPPALPTMPPSREPPPTKDTHRTLGTGGGDSPPPDPPDNAAQPGTAPTKDTHRTLRTGGGDSPRPIRRTTQAAEPEQLRFRRPCEGPRHQRTRSVRPMRSTVVDLMPFMRQMLLTVVPYLRARAPSVSPERILW